MKSKATNFSFGQITASTMMVLALLWLTVSTPFVFQAQKDLAQQKMTAFEPVDSPGENEESNPFGNTTEEKIETGFNSISEYLHHIDELSHLAASSHKHNFSLEFAVYVAFHGEMLCPPPNAVRS